jgi:hypothetical protein
MNDAGHTKADRRKAIDRKTVDRKKMTDGREEPRNTRKRADEMKKVQQETTERTESQDLALFLRLLLFFIRASSVFDPWLFLIELLHPRRCDRF